ncbi:hypothetical protein Tco_0906121 [Tanacetum coccineum]
MEANNSINRSDIQRQLYKALVDAYEADKILLDTYGDTVTIKRPRDGADDDQEPSAGTDRGSKRRRSGKEPESTSAPRETTTTTAGKTTTDVFEAPAHQEFETGVHDEKGVSHWGKKRRQFYAFAITRESARDVYSKRRIIAVTKVEIVEWQNYKHLDWITVRRDDDTLYKFKEGDFHRLRIQDIEDMLLLLVQGKLTNLNAWKTSLSGVESYQKKLNLTKPDMYRSNLKRKDTYTPYSNPRGFIYENKDKKNRLMRIDELHKFVKTLSMIPEHAEYDESNTHVLERFNTTAGNPVKKILLKLNLSDHRLIKDGGGGGDNKPPMLEKHLYDSWKSRMELYMLNRPHGRMILASVEKGPLVWPSITVDGANWFFVLDL